MESGSCHNYQLSRKFIRTESQNNTKMTVRILRDNDKFRYKIAPAGDDNFGVYTIISCAGPLGSGLCVELLIYLFKRKVFIHSDIDFTWFHRVGYLAFQFDM